MKITKRAAAISPSLTLAITAKANKMKEEGISIIGFGAGEPDFNTPDYIIEAAKKALDNGKTKYTPASGLASLREAVAKKFREDNGLEYSPKQIIISNGAKHSLYNAVMAIVEEGDEVIIPSPYWLTYPELVKLADGKPVYVETTEESEFKLTAAQLRKAIGKRTKALILNSPSNPTGSVYTQAELKALAEVIEETGIYVISDEIYEKLVYDGVQHFSIAAISDKMKQQTIVVNGISKTYSMTGWRIGYLAAPENLAAAISGMQSHATSNPNTIAQYATLAALDGGEDFLKTMHHTFDERRKYMVQRIEEIPYVTSIVPKGAFYVFMNVKSLFNKTFQGKKVRDSLTLTDMLLSVGVAVVPGAAFGDDQYVRLSYAISLDDIKEGLDRIEKFISQLV